MSFPRCDSHKNAVTVHYTAPEADVSDSGSDLLGSRNLARSETKVSKQAALLPRDVLGKGELGHIAIDATALPISGHVGATIQFLVELGCSHSSVLLDWDSWLGRCRARRRAKAHT